MGLLRRRRRHDLIRRKQGRHYHTSFSVVDGDNYSNHRARRHGQCGRTWDNSPESYGTFQSYTYQYWPVSNPSNVTPKTLTSSVDAIGGLTLGTVYSAIVQANYSNGISEWSPVITFEADPFVVGPQWVAAYKITSDEATVNWATVESAERYQIAYKATSEVNWHIVTSEGIQPIETIINATSTLTPQTTYEVKVRAERTVAGNPDYSNWCTEDVFYTLERPWVEFLYPTSNSAVLMWGPEVSTATTEIPLAVSYTIQYKKIGTSNWVTYAPSWPLNNTSHSISVNPNLTATLEGLTAGASYEVRIETVDNTNGVSIWGYVGGDYPINTLPPAGVTLTALRAPYWIAAINITSEAATLIWDTEPNLESGFTKFEYEYWQVGNPSSIQTVETSSTMDAILLAPNTTYGAQVLAEYGSEKSDWSPATFFYSMNGPQWISNFSTTTSSTELNWQPVTGIDSIEVIYGISTEPVSWTNWAPNDSTLSSSEGNGGPISGLTARKWYEAEIRAHKGAYASAWSAPDYFYTIPEPYIYSWTPTDTSITINWTTSELDSTTPCTSYEVSWGTTPSAEGNDFTTGANTATLTGLTTGDTYYIMIRARDDVGGGYSSWSPYPPLAVTALSDPVISALDVTDGFRGTTITISGANFGGVQGLVSFESGGTVIAGLPGYWINNYIGVAVPPGALAGVNSISIVRQDGKVATAPVTFNVHNGAVVIDDFEGGTWQYSTFESGGANHVYYSVNSTPPLEERSQYCTYEAQGSSTYEIAGGVTPYGNLASQNGIDISVANVIHFWFKGDGSSNVATFELVESNQAPGNSAVRSEIWDYNVPISFSDTSWHLITIPLTTEGAASFELDSYYTSGNRALDLNMIKGYQIQTGGPNPKRFDIDYIIASYEAPISIITNATIVRLGDTAGVSGIQLNWSYIGVPSNVDIWSLVGTFEPTVGPDWQLQASNVSGTSWTDPNTKVGDGITKWYQVVKTGTGITNAMISNGTLGKWDYV